MMQERTAGEPGLCWSSIASVVASGVAVWDAKTQRLRGLNPAFARIHGYDGDNLLGRHISAFYSIDRGCDVLHVLRSAAPRGYGGCEANGIRKDGSNVLLVVYLTLLQGSGGDSELFVTTTVRPEAPVRDEYQDLLKAASGAFLRDMSKRKEAEAALKRGEQLAALGVLTAGIAHELSNSLGAALLSIETALSLLARSGADPQVLLCLQEAIQSMNRSGEIVRSVIEFSCGEQDKRPQ